jgi:Fic family protein
MYYIYKHYDWPNFTWDQKTILKVLPEIRHVQGKVFGKMSAMGFSLQSEAVLETLSLDIIKSSEIEGEILNAQSVRSSIAKRLGIDVGGTYTYDRNIEGFTDIMIDATQKFDQPLSLARLFAWHTSIFPYGSDQHKVTVGKWRTDRDGPMRVVSGMMGKDTIHFEAPEANLLEAEMKKFIDWFNNENDIDPILKAAIAHLWFITLHPFEDGNGRIARVLTDLLLARSDGSAQRFYSMSAQIRIDRKQYYDILERTQKGQLDITPWILWFLDCLKKALLTTESHTNKVLAKASFWSKHIGISLNARQNKIIHLLLNDFEGKLNTSKWAKICKCSTDTALRDIQDLQNKGVLQQEIGGGRSTSYILTN